MNSVLSFAHRVLFGIFLYVLPLGLLVLLSPIFPVVDNVLENRFVGPIVAILYVSWTLSSLYFFFAILLNRSFREHVLAKLARIRENDEREEYIVGKATKSGFLFTLAVLIVLFSVSTFRYGESTTNPKDYQSLTVGHFHIKSRKDESSKKMIDGKEHVIQQYDLPLSKSSILLLLIVTQVLSYNFFARKYSRQGQP